MVTTASEGLELNNGDFEPAPLSENAKVVIERRVARRNDRGDAQETPDQVFRRVAQNLAEAELRFGGAEGDRAAESDARAYGPGLREPDEDALRQLAELLGTDPLPSSLRLFREEYLSTAGDQVALQVSP